jgi:hypothetical protein
MGQCIPRRPHPPNAIALPEHEEGAAPAHPLDKPLGHFRHHQRADADARHRKAGCEAAPAREPALHGADRRHISEADPDADAEPIADVDVPERLRAACEEKAEAKHDDADQRHAARPEAVGERPAPRAEDEIKEDRDRENPGQGGAGGTEGVLQRREKGRETVGAAEGRKHHAERAGDDAPAAPCRTPLVGDYARSMHGVI